MHPSMHPFSITGSPSLRVTGVLEPVCCPGAKALDTPLQFTAGPHRDKQPVNFTWRDNLHLLISARPCSALCEEAAGPGENQCRRRMK